MVHQRRKTIKGHKARDPGPPTEPRTLAHMRGPSLDNMTDKDLGRCARLVINNVLRPGLQSEDGTEAATCRHILDQLVIASGMALPHAGAKWIGNNAIRLHAMVMRRRLRRYSLADAYRDIEENYILPVDALLSKERKSADDPVDRDTVKKTHRRALKHLDDYMMRQAVERLALIEYVRETGNSLPAGLPGSLDPIELALPAPLLPPEFRRRGESEPPHWEIPPAVEKYLMARHSAKTLRAAGTEKQ
jgi:hypothetical protein